MKNERGLGISVYGGIDANVPYRGLIRIKRIFPNQSAWSTGMLQQGDILLEGNGIKLTGLTNHVSDIHKNLLYNYYSHCFIVTTVRAYLRDGKRPATAEQNSRPCNSIRSVCWADKKMAI